MYLRHVRPDCTQGTCDLIVLKARATLSSQRIGTCTSSTSNTEGVFVLWVSAAAACLVSIGGRVTSEQHGVGDRVTSEQHGVGGRVTWGQHGVGGRVIPCRANSIISAMLLPCYSLLEKIVILGVIYGSLVWRVCNPAGLVGGSGAQWAVQLHNITHHGH